MSSKCHVLTAFGLHSAKVAFRACILERIGLDRMDQLAAALDVQVVCFHAGARVLLCFSSYFCSLLFCHHHLCIGYDELT